VPSLTPLLRREPLGMIVDLRYEPTAAAGPERAITELSGPWQRLFGSTSIGGSEPASQPAVHDHVADSAQGIAFALATSLTPLGLGRDTWAKWLSRDREGGLASHLLGLALSGVLGGVVWHVRQEGTRRGDPELIRPLAAVEPGPRSPAFRAFKQLGRWLDASDDEVATAVGVGRTTPYSWERMSRPPSPRTTRRLHQLHSLVAGLVNRASAGEYREWLYEGGAFRRIAALSGDHDTLEAEAEPILFGQPRRRIDPGTWFPETESPDRSE
jgi:hypothetical protein